MKHILIFPLCISVSLISFSQKRDTISLFEKKKVENKDAVKEIQSSSQSEPRSFYYIKYGKSNTKCEGYCFNESIIDSIKIVTIKKPWQPDNKFPVKTDTALTKDSQWNSLKSSVDMNSFFSIPTKIGKPGEGTGDAEWIEIKYTGRIHKITFDSTGPDEYEGIKNLLLFLRQMTAF
jgi:hypothetical protein